MSEPCGLPCPECGSPCSLGEGHYDSPCGDGHAVMSVCYHDIEEPPDFCHLWTVEEEVTLALLAGVLPAWSLLVKDTAICKKKKKRVTKP